MFHTNIAGVVGLALCIGFNTTSVRGQELDRDTYKKKIAPDLAIVQVATPAVAKAGSEVTFKLTVTNKRPASAPHVTVSDVLPPSTAFVSCTLSVSGACEGTGNDRRVLFESLAGGASATITLVATLNRDVPPGTRVTNTATVSFEGTDPDMTNNAATATISAGSP